MAAARAEARRKAILARGNDRLAKLTTSARGEDSPVYNHEDPPVPSVTSGLRSFVGEESSMPAPRPTQSRTPSASSRSQTPSFGIGGPPPDPSAWSEEQQKQFMQALMGGVGGTSLPQMSNQPQLPSSSPGTPGSETRADFDPFAGANGNDPLSALMAQLSKGQPGSAPNMPPPKPKQPPTLLQKLLPLLHILSVWALLAYFVIWREPEVSAARTYGLDSGHTWGRRWAELGRGKWTESGWGVQAVPFFYAFLTLQIALHSLRIYSGFDAIQPPLLLTLALPHLPAPIPSIVVNGLKYVQMGGFLLDDIAGLVVGVAAVITIGGLLDHYN